MWVIRSILVLLLLLVVVAFAYNNSAEDQKVAVQLEPVLPNYINVPLVTVVFWSFVAGAVLSMLLFVSSYLKQSVQGHLARKKIKALESEVMVLRNRPIEESAELIKGADRKQDEMNSPFTGL